MNSEAKRFKEAFTKYGTHTDECDLDPDNFNFGSKTCTCGWQELYDEVKEEARNCCRQCFDEYISPKGVEDDGFCSDMCMKLYDKEIQGISEEDET